MASSSVWRWPAVWRRGPAELLLDEPFSSLDARLREIAREETLAVLRETNVTSLIVTHDPEEAMVLGDRVALLRRGCIAQIGTGAEIYRRPIDLSAARFFSPLSEIEAVVSHGLASTSLGDVPTPGLADGARVTIAIRPAGGARLRLTGPGAPGRVVSKRDSIGEDIYEVKVAGLEPPLGVRQPASTALAVGQDVFATLNLEHVLVFARV
ncbi:MAG: hypothetical protein MO852_13680 [Candidatus Devosia euplotis]|nr:hypothetical protein [Candidatus Devosia euplotis]